MVTDILRRVVGYNTWYASYYSTHIDTGEHWHLNCASGPGEFYGMTFLQWGGNNYAMMCLYLQVLVDGVEAYNERCGPFGGVNFYVDGVSMFGTSKVDSSNKVLASIKMPIIPYASTLELVLTNPDGGDCDLLVTYYHAVYR